MKLTFILTTLNPSDGGAAISSRVLIESLMKKGHEVTVVSFDGVNKQFFTEGKMKRIQFHKPRWYPLTLDLTLKTFQVMRKLEKESDLFYISQLDAISGAGLYKFFRGKKKVLATLNGYAPICAVFQCSINNKACKGCTICKYRLKCIRKFSRGFFEKNLFAFFYSLLFPLTHTFFSKRINHYVAVSEATKKIYTDFGFENNKISVIPNMVDSDFSSQNTRKKRKNKEFIILYVGRLKPSKGVNTLIKAFEMLDENNKRLLIIGSGVSEKDIQKQISSSRDKNRITQTSYINYKDLSKYYADADVFVHPGIWSEPFGRTIIEAVSAHIPMIVSDIGAPPEIIGTYGLKFQPGNALDLKKQLEKVMYSSFREKFIPPISILNKYKSENVVNSMEKLLLRFQKNE